MTKVAKLGYWASAWVDLTLGIPIYIYMFFETQKSNPNIMIGRANPM